MSQVDAGWLVGGTNVSLTWSLMLVTHFQAVTWWRYEAWLSVSVVWAVTDTFNISSETSVLSNLSVTLRNFGKCFLSIQIILLTKTNFYYLFYMLDQNPLVGWFLLTNEISAFSEGYKKNKEEKELIVLTRFINIFVSESQSKEINFEKII